MLRLSSEARLMDDLVLGDHVKERLQYIVDENAKLDDLRALGLKPKRTILFCGPPGTGKTLSARIMSSMIGYRFAYILFDSIVSSLLGETATNMRKVFSFVEEGRYVALFDEFDIVGKSRDDPTEHGEIKRVVNHFMQMLDTYDGDSIIIAATNHPHLLDGAVWRRFDEILHFDLPGPGQRREILEKYLGYARHDPDCDLERMARNTGKYSPADLAQICKDAIRFSVIRGRDTVLNSDMEWAFNEQKRRKRAIRKGA